MSERTEKAEKAAHDKAEKAEQKAEKAAEKAEKAHAAAEGSATWANHPEPRNFFDAGLAAVTIYPTQKEAHKAAKDEAKAAGVTPAAVMHVSPEGGSSGAED